MYWDSLIKEDFLVRKILKNADYIDIKETLKSGKEIYTIHYYTLNSSIEYNHPDATLCMPGFNCRNCLDFIDLVDNLKIFENISKELLGRH